VYRIPYRTLQWQVTGGKRDDVPVFAWNDLMPGSKTNFFGTAKNKQNYIFSEGRWVRAKQGISY